MKSCFVYGRRTRAFSLVEMLMALLVASLLMVALAPVMTKKFNEIVTISGLGERKYDPNLELVVFKDNDDFNIPNLVSRITVYMAGGGGAGGVSRYGKQEFTAPNNTFTVPDGVYKLRVFMVGGGGAGGGGGVGKGSSYGTLGGTANSAQLTTAGTGNWTIPASAKGNVPEIPQICKDSGITKWKLVSDTTKEVEPKGTIVNVLGCGAGGGGGAAGYGSGMDPVNNGTSSSTIGAAGGSGGYLTSSIIVAVNKSTTSIPYQVGGGGGGASPNDNRNGASNTYAFGSCGGGGGGGDDGYYSYFTDCSPGPSYGGAGGAHSTIESGGGKPSGKPGQSLLNSYAKGGDGVDGGSGGDSGTSPNNYYYSSWTYGGGGGGGKYGGGGGGSGAAAAGGGGGGPTYFNNELIGSGGGGGGGGAFEIKNGWVCPGGGGGGGGGAGGGRGGNGASLSGSISARPFTAEAAGAGSGGSPNTLATNTNGTSNWSSGTGYSLYGADRCRGGRGEGASGYTDRNGEKGKDGIIKLSWGPQANIIRCDYDKPANGGAGGGGGQVWFGEIPVNPGDTLSITVGTGGSAVTSDYARQGGNGGNTIIVHKKKVGGATTTYKVVGGEGGKYEESVTSLSSARGKGGGVGDSMFNWNTAEITDADFAALVGGTYGGAGGSVASGAGGGNGGNAIDKDGKELKGPTGGTSKTKGADAVAYGTGGAGGGGLQSSETGFPGYGGNGAQGYVYIEWGGTNGGGGTAGEFVKKSINNLDNDDRALHITIGKGGDNDDTVGLGNGGVTTVSIKTGKGIVTQNAAGGMKGADGGPDIVPKVHGAETAPTWTIQDYKNFITPGMEAVVNGKAGSDDFGGIGGRLEFIYKALLEDGTSELQATVTATDGSGTVNSSLPGCGGASNGLQSDESDCNPSADGDNSPNGGDGRSAAGGGGGAVRGENAGKGGKGGDGFVILEYKSLGM